MKSYFCLVAAGVVSLAAASLPAFAGQQNAPGEPVSVVVTVEPKHGKTIPALEPQDITVQQGHDKRPVTGLTPLPAQSTTQLLLLIDDSARGTFDTELGTLKQFITSLPSSYEVGVAYMRNGMAAFTQQFTRDHAAAANSIRVAYGPGGADVSPYDSLTDAAKHWPSTPADRRVVVMISSGIEALGGGWAPDNPYVNAGIESAQRAGLIVYTIYSPSVGHFGHSYWRSTWGQNFLSQLSDETGGEMYWIGFGSPVSFQPFLQQIMLQLQHQYRLTFVARAEQKSGMQPVRIAVTEKDASLVAPDKVFVKAGL
jgi:VWFA-related protein